jgi:long-chain acyl-CoA synthetase
LEKNFKFWPEGVEKHIDYPEIPAFEILRSSARKWPERNALIFQGEEITYRELDSLSDRFAAALAKLGVGKGHRVGIHLPNSPQFAIAYFGILKAGAVFVPISTMLAEKELSFLLRDAGVETYVGLDTACNEKNPALSGTPVQRVIPVNLSGEAPAVKSSPPETRDFAALLKDSDPNPPRIDFNPREDLAHIAYTGGTTGTPKGAMITHYNVVVNTCQYFCWFAGGVLTYRNGIIDIERREGDREENHCLLPGRETVLVVSPWFHAMGVIGYVNRLLILGATIVVFPRFDPEEFLRAIPRYRPTFFGGAPALFIPLIEHPLYRETDMSGIKAVGSGAAILSPSLISALEEKFPRRILEGYGMTEATMGAVNSPPTPKIWRPGSVGLPIPDTEIKIVDPEKGEAELPIGETGEICIRGPQVMKGYLNRPEETAQVLRSGWLYSGDIGRLDEDGFLYIVDRKKDMLIYKGYNVYPRDLEETLNSHPAVAQSAVVGKKDPRSGELPVAFVRLVPGKTATEQELIEYANQRLAAYKKIRILKIVEALPVSAAGKILKRELKKIVESW